MMICLLFLGMGTVHADATYPPSQGIVTDLAGVLGEGTVRDMEALAHRMEDAGLGRMYVVTRHFLGGKDAAVYARALFDDWGLQGDDVLLLMVIGEENAVLWPGDGAKNALSSDVLTGLMASHFRGAFLRREYDAALADVSVQTAQTLAKGTGTRLNTAGLFGISAVQSTPQPKGTASPWQSLFSLQDYREEDEAWDTWTEEWSGRSGFSFSGWLIWGLVIYFLFFRKKKKYDFSYGPRSKRR